MAPTRGGFQNPDAHTRCTAMSRRTGEQCKAPAVTGSRTQKCRMHGGTSTQLQGGANNHSFKHGRKSRVLREGSRISDLYHEALADPDLTSMNDHIALLDARMSEVLERSIDDTVPEWHEFVTAVGELEEAWVKEDKKAVQAAITILHRIVEAGQKWDTTWNQVTGLMDNIRKLADTEIKRKKDLGMMIPIDRVVALMVAVGHSVKARVSNIEEVEKVFGDIARLHGMGQPAGDGIIDVGPSPDPDPDPSLDPDPGLLDSDEVEGVGIGEFEE